MFMLAGGSYYGGLSVPSGVSARFNARGEWLAKSWEAAYNMSGPEWAQFGTEMVAGSVFGGAASMAAKGVTLLGRLGRAAPMPGAGLFEAGTDIVQRTAREQAASYESVVAGLTPAELRAFNANPKNGSRFLGQSVHRQTDIALYEKYGERFKYNSAQ